MKFNLSIIYIFSLGTHLSSFSVNQQFDLPTFGIDSYEISDFCLSEFNADENDSENLGGAQPMVEEPGTEPLEVENEEPSPQHLPSSTKRAYFCKCKDCPDANKKFESKKKLFHHVDEAHFIHWVRTKTCPWQGCSVQKPQKRELFNHCNIQHIGYNGFRCKACKNKFYSKQSLRSHKRKNCKQQNQVEATQSAVVPHVTPEQPKDKIEAQDYALQLQQRALQFQEQALQFGLHMQSLAQLQLQTASYPQFYLNPQASIHPHFFPNMQIPSNQYYLPQAEPNNNQAFEQSFSTLSFSTLMPQPQPGLQGYQIPNFTQQEMQAFSYPQSTPNHQDSMSQPFSYNNQVMSSQYCAPHAEINGQASAQSFSTLMPQPQSGLQGYQIPNFTQQEMQTISHPQFTPNQSVLTLPTPLENDQIISGQHYPPQVDQPNNATFNQTEVLPQTTNTLITPANLSKPYKCKLHSCTEEFEAEDSWIDHINRIHILTCRWKNCKDGPFATFDDLMNHIKRKH